MAPSKSSMATSRRETRASAAVTKASTPKPIQPATRQGLRRSTRSVVANSTGSESSDVLSSPVKPAKSMGIMIEIPESSNAADYATLSSSPESPEDSVFDKAADDSNGNTETPSITIPNTTPADSDVGGSSRPKRVNASARAAELRNSAFAMGSRAKTTRKRPAAAMADTTADEAFARALQEEEYGQPNTSTGPNKKAKTTGRKTRSELVIEDSDDSERTPVSEMSPLSSLSPSPGPPLLVRFPTNPGKYVRRPRVKSAVGETSESESTTFERYISDSDEEMGDASDNEDATASNNPITNPDTSTFDVDAAIATNRGNWRTQVRTRRADRERNKLEKNHPELATMWDNLENTPSIVPTPDPQPAAINRRLKPFQLEGVNWMRRQEQTIYKGGLLGDEMGMGKTIQAVSLLMSDYPAREPSLVVVPPVALMQWSSEIASYTDGKLKVLVYHNSNAKVKHLTAKQLKAYDVIMISYSGLESMHRKEVKGWTRRGGLVKEDSVIHSIRFHRLILDEAHSIKQRSTSVARACFALKSKYKWCLSGTPVQNRIGEFFSLLRFLEVKPFACYFCKQCSCSELHWSQNAQKKCTGCGHSGFQHVSVFNQEILNPITEPNAASTKRKAAFKKLRLLTDKIMLRRMKQDHTSSMELPPKRVQIHNEFFGEMERDFSSSIMTNTSRQFDTYVSRGVMLNNYANIFGLIMQMRQVANHPDLLLKKHTEGGQNVLVCGICDEPAEEAVRSRCKHEFCRQCVKDYISSFEASGEPDCPRCHIALSIDLEQPDIEQHDDVKKNSIINRIRMDNWTSSTKIEMLVYDLYKLRSKKQTHKSIVFSQFTSMLQLVEWRLRRAGISTVMLDGSMTPAQRQKSIEYFMNNVDVEVFLVSLKAGGVALNLTEASRVFIVDPWWNPAAEWQSADRCHRIGQRRPCVITRLCIEDSVESRMVLLQEKKANMIRGTLNKDQTELLEKLTPQDMQFLFRGS